MRYIACEVQADNQPLNHGTSYATRCARVALFQLLSSKLNILGGATPIFNSFGR